MRTRVALTEADMAECPHGSLPAQHHHVSSRALAHGQDEASHHAMQAHRPSHLFLTTAKALILPQVWEQAFSHTLKYPQGPNINLS